MKGINCPRCGSEMEECDLSFEEMTEGQMADYMAGLWRTFSCPQCGLTDTYEEHFASDYEDDLSDRKWRKPHILRQEVEKEETLRCFQTLEKSRRFEYEVWLLERKARGLKDDDPLQDWEYQPLSERLKEAIRVTYNALRIFEGDEHKKAVKIFRGLCERGHKEARRLYPHPKPCEVRGCKKDGTRHHKDGNPGNNRRSNIAWLCRKHHGMPKYFNPKWWAKYGYSKKGG